VPVGFVDDTSATGGGLAAYTVHSDAMGHPRIICDSHGDMVWRCTLLDAYGKLGVEDKHKLRYAARWPGHWWDADIELQNNRFRWYDPRVGRYIESDPLGTAGGVNLYAYAANPTCAVDLLGLTTCPRPSQSATPPSATKDPPAERVAHPSEPDAVAGTPPHDPHPTHVADDNRAFPGLRRGGEDVDPHANKVRDVMSGPVNRERRRAEVRDLVAREYDARTQREVERLRSPERRQEVLRQRAMDREAHINTRVAREGSSGTRNVSSKRCGTVILHKNGTVSVAISGSDPERMTSAREVVEELNHRYPAVPPTYATARERIPIERLETAGEDDQGRTAPDRGNCAEPLAATTAGENPSPPIAFQTFWVGQGEAPEHHQIPDRPRIGDDGAELMNACRTCQLNGHAHNAIAGIPR
jgi:RHS repeat-associated protein